MDEVSTDLYERYLKFVDNLERELVATLGHTKAMKLLQRMDRSRFEAVCEAAATDTFKHHWLDRLLPGYARDLNRGEKGEAA